MLNREKDTPPPESARGGGSPAPETSTLQEPSLWPVWEDVRRGAEYFHQRSLSLPVNRLGQLVHGLCLPFHLLRMVWADRPLRRRYLAVSVTQAIAVVGLAVLFTGSGKEVVEKVGPEEWREEHQEEIQRRREEAEARLEEARERMRKLEGVAQGAGRLAGLTGADAEKVRASVEKALKEAQEAQDRRREERDAARDTEDKLERSVARSMRWAVYLAALLSSLQIAQWIVYALSRDYHTELAREVSLRSGVPPEDEPLEPRVRFNWPWLRTKMKRRWRALLMFGFGVPVLWALTLLLPWREHFFAMLMSLWGAWWFVLFTAGKSALAWKEEDAGEPWFLRAWNAFPGQFPVLGAYGTWWTKHTREAFSPAASVERRPWGFMGLAVVKALASLPLVKCFLRPVIPVASAHLHVAEQSGRPPSQAR